MEGNGPRGWVAGGRVRGSGSGKGRGSGRESGSERGSNIFSNKSIILCLTKQSYESKYSRENDIGTYH